MTVIIIIIITLLIYLPSPEKNFQILCQLHQAEKQICCSYHIKNNNPFSLISGAKYQGDEMHLLIFLNFLGYTHTP